MISYFFVWGFLPKSLNLLSAIFKFVVIYSDDINAVETGNLSNWRKYYEDYFVPINILFRESKGVEFQKVKNDYKVEMELVTDWQAWGICQICGRSKDEGVRKRIGVCRIKLTKKVSIFKQLLIKLYN